MSMSAEATKELIDVLNGLREDVRQFCGSESATPTIPEALMPFLQASSVAPEKKHSCGGGCDTCHGSTQDISSKAMDHTLAKFVEATSMQQARELSSYTERRDDRWSLQLKQLAKIANE